MKVCRISSILPLLCQASPLGWYWSNFRTYSAVHWTALWLLVMIKKFEPESILNKKIYAKERKNILRSKDSLNAQRYSSFHHRLDTTCLQNTRSQTWHFVAIVFKSNFSKLPLSCEILESTKNVKRWAKKHSVDRNKKKYTVKKVFGECS